MKINSMTLKNRFVRSATYDGSAEKTGHVSQKQIEIFQKLAQGGVGLIVTGITSVHACGQISSFQNSLASDDCIEGFKAMSDTVHDHGAKIAVQLFHGGREIARIYRPEKKQAIAPSFIDDDPYFRGPYRAMTREDIHETVQAFGDAAERARKAGVDAVQVHGAHAYLLSQFLSPFTNRRDDQWGGALLNRLRLHHEIIKAIRAKVGPDYPVLIKIGVQDRFPEGLLFQDGKEAALHLARWGFDALEISSGLRGHGYENSEFQPHIVRLDQEGYFRQWCGEICRKVDVPVMMVGGLRSPGLMEEVIRNGETDFVSLSRPLIREPGIINKWKAGERQRAACVSCNQCFDRLLKGTPLHCVLETEQQAPVPEST
jgi:2,4-dienoyl-CoA reductase-like NADH-dependent reductase (Old Yellow Enzyme family)